jgi:hypothetical protein
MRNPYAESPLPHGEVLKWHGCSDAERNHKCSLSSLQCEFAARPFGTGPSEWTDLSDLRRVSQRLRMDHARDDPARDATTRTISAPALAALTDDGYEVAAT